jgi:hypothetical protein
VKDMHPSITNVVPTDDYILLIDFDNGEHGTLDMKPFLDFGIFKQLKDRDTFKQVRVSFDTVEWSSGIDLDPEFVYEKCSRTSSQQGAPADTDKPNG